MCKRLIFLTSLVLVLSLVGSASAAVPAGWLNQDVGSSSGGSADEADGTWTITGEGADIWGSADAFHYAYVELTGNAVMVARVVDNGSGTNEWAKGGVMIRQSLDAGSTHRYMPLTAGGGNGASFQGRPVADGSSVNVDSGEVVAPPYWVKLERVGNDFSGSISPDGVTWTQLGDAATVEMTNPVLIGLAVTSHQTGELRTFTFDNVSIELLENTAVGPIPADGAVDVDTASLEWTAGAGAVSHKVYLSTDDTIDDSDLAAETNLTIHLAALDVGAAYYWRVDEVDADGAVTEGDVWSFTTLPLEAHFPSPADGAMEVKTGTKLEWTAGKGVIMHDVYFGTDEALVAAGDPSTFKGKVMITSFDPGAFEAAVAYYWKIDEFSVTGTNPGPVWSLTGFDPDVASDPDPANGAGDVEDRPVLNWVAGETATLYDIYFDTDPALVEAGDASVLQGQQAEIGFAPADALERGITYYWKVDVVTADEKMHPGKLWSLTVLDRNTNNWAAIVAGDSPAYLDTFVEDGLYDIGALSGDITYEFVVKSNPDETEASMALIGRRQFGDTQAGIKYEQWNNTGTYGATLFGVVDLDYGVPTAPGEYTVLTFVSSEDAATTKLYVNGVQEGSVDSAITLSGLVGIGYGAEGADMTGAFDNFDGAIFGVAIYDEALADDVITKHSDSYFTPIAIADPDLLIYYDFESGEGLTALDRSGHGNHGLFLGTPEWSTGIYGGGVKIELDEVDYIQTAAPLNIVSNTVSVAGWVKHDELPAGWSGILTHRGTSPGCLGLQHDGTELRYMWGADVYWSFSSGLPLPVGEWYFAALTISPEQGKLYLNGVEQTATNVAPHELTNFDSEIRVARDHNDDRIMTCLIDEVRFYNKTLTDVEVLGIMGTFSDVTAPGDVVKGVPDEPRDGSVAGWPDGEYPGLAVDDDASTKFLHFKGEVEPTGFVVEPASGASIVTGLTFTTANDATERDPISFELSGSNDSIDGPYTLIASGDIVDFAQEAAWPRFTKNATAISFANNVAYAYYQVMFPAVRDPGSANSMQIAEVELLSDGAAPGATIAWVSYHAADDEPHADAAAVGFTQAPDIEYTDLLKAQGYNVVRVLTSQEPDVEFLNTMDLVIISRTASSGHYSGGGASLWNSVTAPMINLNGYTLRNSRMGYTTGGTMVDTTGDVKLTVTDPAHPIFAGIALTDGTMDNLFAEGAVPLPTDETILSRGISVNNDPAEDEGVVLATIAEASADTGPVGGMVIAEWPAGATMENSSGSPDDVLGGPRLVFLTGSREPDGVTGGQAAALYDLYEDGTQMFLNAVEYMLPSAAADNLLANGGFEDGVPDPWSTYGDASLEVVQDDPVEGSSCLHVTVGSAGANFWDAGLQHGGHVFEAGKSYTLSAYLKAKEGTMNINFKPELAADPWTGYGSQEFTMTDTWAEYTVNTGVIPETVDPGSITFHIAYTAGEFYVDDVRFTED